MIISKDSTPEQKEALRQALRQQSLQMAVRGAAPEDIQSLPEDFEPPSYSENTRPLYDGQLFPQITSADDLIANGYATPDGQPTEQGKMAISLKKVGALNDDYTLNDTGRAMLMSQEDLFEPENLSAYAKAKDLKLDGEDITFTESVAELWGKTKDLARAVEAEIDPYSGAIKAAGSIAAGPFGLPKAIAGAAEQVSEGLPSEEERAAATIRRQTAVEDFSEQGVQTLLGAGELMFKGALGAKATTPFGVTPEFIEEAKKDQAILAASQARDRVNNNVQKVSLAEALDDFTGLTNLVGAYQEAESVLGTEKAQEAVKQGEALGLAASIINPAAPEAIAFGVGARVASKVAAPFSGAVFRAEQKAAQVLDKTKALASLQKQTAEYQFAARAVEQRAIQAEQTADKLSKAGFVERANNARNVANRIRMQGQEAGQKLGSLQDEMARVSGDLAVLSKDATVADKMVQLTQKAKELPFKSITGLGKAIEYTGRGMIGIDKGLSNLAAKIGADKAYNAMNKITTLSGLGTVVSAAGVGPAAFIPAAIKTAWSTAPFIKATGEYVGMLGREAAKARGQIGFWKRVYNMPNQGFTQNMIAGLADTATLGGNLTGLGVRTGKGILAAVPADLAFQYVAEGGDMDMGSINQALAESVFFGGTGAALGGITMGSKNRIRSLQNGDALNFYRSITDGNQRVMFNAMSGDMKRAIGTFSASYPGSKILFSNEGAGSYDRNTKTLVINPNSRNPLKPLLTHEFMHHMMNNGIGEGIVANLIGDGYQTGGILRNKDGSYDAQYEQFKTEYVNDLRNQHERNVRLRDAIGDPMTKAERVFQVPDEKYLAEEYFIESNVDDMLGLVESGKLGKMAGRMIISDKMRALGDAILNKSAVLKDLHFRLGGVMDSGGKMVTGNGFLGGKLYQSPEIRRMFKKMVNESVGRKAGIDAAKNKARNGIEIQVTGKKDPILASLDSLWESDGDVPLVDKNGDYVPLKKETEELRSTAGLLLVDDLQKRQARGDVFEPGELAYNPENNTWSGSFLTDNQIKLLKLSGRFSNVQIRQLELLNAAAKTNSDPNAAAGTRGNRFSLFYQPALKKNRKGQWRYDQIKPQLRDVVPYGVEISKDGNILIRIMSTNQLFANAAEKAATKRGRLLYEGNIDAILQDANAMIDAHGKEQKPESSDRHFKDKYGANWEDHKKFINSVFGNVGAGHKDINPLVSSDRVDAVVKSYRLDRINKATQLVGATKIPYQNNLIKINYLPEGEPILDENSEPKDLRYTPRAEDRVMPEQRQMPDVSPEDLNPVANKQEAQGLWADGKRMFALNEMDEKLTPITSKAMLDSYSADAIGWMEPEAQAGQTRFMPEGVDEDKFYSQLDRVITDKVPSRATPQQIMATIDPTRGSGVKAEEIKWSGIEQALASLEKDGKVSKEDLLNYLRNEGRVRFEEVDVGKAFTPQDLEQMRKEAEQSGDFSRYDEALLQNLHDGTKYAKYQLPGGENYREVVLAMPDPKKEIALLQSEYQEIRSGQRGPITSEMSNRLTEINARRNKLESELNSTYTSSHFRDIPNYVAHMRTNERVDADGRPGLFVEEFQSDRHQEGRKKGYRGDKVAQKLEDLDIEQLRDILRTADPNGMWSDSERENEGFGPLTKIEALDQIKEFQKEDPSFDVESFLRKRSNVDGVADAPFRTTWPLQLFKRALRDAVDSGKEWVGWTTGETQAERFDLSRQVDAVEIFKRDTGNWGVIATKNGNRVLSREATTTQLPDLIGKELAEKAVSEGGGTYKGDDLKVGGSGMKGFYDNMLPKEIGKYVKPFGGKVEKSEIDIRVPEENAWYEEPKDEHFKPIWKVSITPEMRQLAQGQMRFMPEKIDADYMKAVESGDVESQQKVVNDAAEKAEYFFDGWHWSQSEKEFNVFDPELGNAEGFHFGTKDAALDRRSGREGEPKRFFLKGKYTRIVDRARNDALSTAEQLFDAGVISRKELHAVKAATLKRENRTGSYGVTPKSLESIKEDNIHIERLEKSLGRETGTPEEELIRAAGERVYHYRNTVEGKGADSQVVYSPNQIKSADPITRDDSGNIIPPSKRFDITSKDLRFMPEMPNAPQDTSFRSITEQGREAIGNNYKGVVPGAILGTVRFMPEAENDRILANFPLGEDEKQKLEGKAGFAFVSDWSDSNRPYITKNGREIDVLMGGVGYTYHPEVIGKGGWAGSFSALTNRVLNKINETDGIGLVVAGGRDSTASSRSFSIAALEELKDDIANKTVSKSAIDNIIKNNAERLLGLKNIKSLDDYEKLVMLERGGSGLTFEQRADMIKAINSHENKKSFGISNWNDILKKYEMQNGIFVPGQIMSVVQFKKNAPLVKASDLNIKGHKSYEAVIQGKPIGMLKEKVMIGDFFKDFFESHGTLPANYTRKVQTKMPSFKYGEGSAVLKETAKSIANAAKLK